jgi:hypothetical protein
MAYDECRMALATGASYVPGNGSDFFPMHDWAQGDTTG